MTGILVVNKPMDYTSHDVVAILRGITHEKRIGHTGTLDPNATGVLPVCFGRATKLIEYMEAAPKSYSCTAKLGMTSNTDDIWGEVVRRDSFEFPSIDTLETVLSSFKGEISQIPPMYSAVRVNGRRLYSYARSGDSVEVKPRTVTIYDIALKGYVPEENEIRFDVTCSRGTYIRTICKEIGEKCSCGALMSGLVRTSTSGFDLSESISFEEIRNNMTAEDVEKHIISINRAVGNLPKITITGKYIKYFKNGLSLSLRGNDSPVNAVFAEDELIGIAKMEGNRLTPIKVFN